MNYDVVAISSPYSCVYLCACSHRATDFAPHTDLATLWTRSANAFLQLVAQTGNQRRRRDRESERQQSRGGRLMKQGEEERRWRTTLIEHSRSQGAYQRDLPTHTPWSASQSDRSHPWPILPCTTAHPWLSEADVRWCGRKRGCEPPGQKTETRCVFNMQGGTMVVWQ